MTGPDPSQTGPILPSPSSPAPSNSAPPPPPPDPLDLTFTAPDSSNPYEPALPHPDPLQAEQFLPVLAPAHFETLLAELSGELPLIREEAARSLLVARARLLRLTVEQYRVHHDQARAGLNRVLAETGLGVRGSWARQQEHLEFMNAASSGVEHAYTRASEQIEDARAARFEALAQHGVTPDTASAEAFYQQQALADLAREGQAIRPLEVRSGSKRVFNGFATFSKFFVGVISGVSINLLFNPESRLYLTLIALTAGVMFSVLLLWLVDELAYRAKLAPGRAARPYLVWIGAVGTLYLGVEGFLNWDGILRVSAQIAANAAQQGQLTDLSTTTDAGAAPQHWSLLVFTLALVAMAAGAALIQGRERARGVLERERLAARVALLKQTGNYAEVARRADHVAYLEAARDRLAPPRDVTSPDHARLNERVLGHWEQEREQGVQSVAAALTREARGVQEALEDFAAQVHAARFPRAQRWPRFS